MLNRSKNFLLKYVFLLFFINVSYAKEEIYVSSSLKDLHLQRKLFLQAEEELKKHKNLKHNELILQKFFKNLSNYPLYPYLQFIALQQSIAEVSLDKLYDFISNYSDTPLIKPLRNTWLLNAAKQQKWKDFLQVYQETDNIEIECYFIQANNKFKNNLENFDAP